MIKKDLDTIPREAVLGTLDSRKYTQNNLFRFLMNVFLDDQAAVIAAFRKYLVGTWDQGEAVFWQIDEAQRVRTGKIIPYLAETGKRRKDRNPNWVHSVLKTAGRLPATFELSQCFFGQQLVRRHPNAPVAVVEAEKTALVASICERAFPGMIWVACGGKSNLSVTKLLRLGVERRIVLYPDADAFDRWTEVSLRARKTGLDVKVSGLIDRLATRSQREIGWDLADLLIELQSNEFRTATVLSVGESKGDDLVAELEERLAIMTIDGGLTEHAARAYVSGGQSR